MEKKKKNWVDILSVLLWLACGICLGLCIVKTADLDAALGEGIGSFLVMYGLYMLLSVVAVTIQLVIHEAGHLVFGLLTGYGFSSFRIFNIDISKRDGRIVIGNKKVAGTGGQCLMVPPEYNNGDFPYILYNLGGMILNLVSSVIFALLYIPARDVPILNTLLLELVVVGVFYAILNGIPMQTKEIPNDGYNALHTGDTEATRRSFWSQLKISERSFNGERVRDMPEELFFLPAPEENANAIVNSSLVFYECRLIDSERYEEANELCYRILSGPYELPGIHRNLIMCDRISTDLLLRNGKCTKEEMEEPKMAEFLKKMTVSPEVLRTKYLVSLLLNNDEAEADKWLGEFEKIAANYPNTGDIESGRQLIRRAQEQRQMIQ